MICWIDTETTCLIPKNGHLLEVAVVITDDDLKEVANMNVVCSPVGCDIGDVQMDEVVRKMHTDNGLLQDVVTKSMRRHEAEKLLMGFVSDVFVDLPKAEDKRRCKCGQFKSLHYEIDRDHAFEPMLVYAYAQTPLAGSTISFDRAWLKEHMPLLEGMFSYRSIDVSALTELAQRWSPETYKFRPKSDDKHRAMSDIRGSIELLRFYRWAGFVG